MSWEERQRRAAEAAARRLAFAEQLAEKLGPGWSAERAENPEAAAIKGPDGMRLHVGSGHWNAPSSRVEISGAPPRSNANGYTYFHQLERELGGKCRVGVSLDRDREAALRDVIRRLVAPYLAAWGRVDRLREENDAEHFRASDFAQRMAELMGTEARPWMGQSSEPPRIVYADVGGASLKLEAQQSGESCRLEITCSHDQAEKIVRALVDSAQDPDS